MNDNTKRTLVYRVCKYNKAISDMQRMKMVKIIGSNPPDTICVSDIAEILHISQPTASKHLKILYDADLVLRKRIGTAIYYSLNKKVVKEYQDLMDDAFIKAFTPCINNFECESCPEMETCH